MQKYTPGEASRLLDIPESSLRRLSHQLEAYLSKQRSRKRIYSERDLSTLRVARDLLDKRYTIEQVKIELGKVVDLSEEESETASQEESQEESVSLIPIARHLTRLEKNYVEQKKELEEMRLSLKADSERLKRLEEWLSQPWWKRLFSRPPL